MGASVRPFSRPKRHEQAFQLALMEMVLHAVSTRKVTDALNAPCRREADRRAAELADDLSAAGKTVAGDWPEENIAEALNVLAPPEHLRKRCASTNSLERLNQQIKRRTNVARVYPNRESLLKGIASLCEHI
jgi:putative transposase